MIKNKRTFFSIVSLIIGFYCFICIILFPIGTLLLRGDYGTWGDIFSFGQFVADLCLIPLAIVGFYLTLNELRKTQEFADLDILWDVPNESNKTYFTTKDESIIYQSNQIFLANNGTSPSTLYQVTLEIPAEYGHIEIKDSSGDWRGGIQGESHKFSFTSNSFLTSFPNASHINLGKIYFYKPEKLPEKVLIQYFIASDKGEYKKGSLEIVFTTSIEIIESKR